MPGWRLLGGALLVSLSAGLLAVAAGLPTSSHSLAAGQVSLTACDGDGVALRHSQDSAGRLTEVRLQGIAPTCAGGTVRLTLLAGSTVASSVSQTLPAGFGSSIALVLPELPAASAITRAEVAIEAP